MPALSITSTWFGLSPEILKTGMQTAPMAPDVDNDIAKPPAIGQA